MTRAELHLDLSPYWRVTPVANPPYIFVVLCAVGAMLNARSAAQAGRALLQIPLHPKAALGICVGSADALAADNRQGGGL